MSFYYIKSKLSDLVLDVEGGGGKAGAKVIPYPFHGKDNQIWYDDASRGVICSKAGNHVLAIANNHLCVEDYQAGMRVSSGCVMELLSETALIATRFWTSWTTTRIREPR